MRTRSILPLAVPTSARSDKQATDTGAQRTIGLGHGVALYVCAILGAGVLVFPGQAGSLAGPASLIAWGFSALIGVPLAFTFAALASRYPDAGGVATFASHAFGPAARGVAGWWYFLAGSIGQTVVLLTAGYYVAAALGLGSSAATATAAVLLVMAVSANLAGLRMGARVQIALALGVAAILLTVVLVAVPHVRSDEFVPFAPHGLSGVGRAVVLLFFAFAGWEAIAHLSAEFRNVGRDLPRATLVTILIVTTLYLGVAWAVIGTGAYGSPGLDRVSLGVVIGRGTGLPTSGAVAVAAVVVCLGTSNAFIASVARLGYSLGRDGWAPAALARTRNDVPATAVLAVGGIAALGLLGAELFGWQAGDHVVVPSVLVLATYLLGASAAVTLFRGGRRAVAGGAVLLLLVTVPFAGWHLVIPPIIAAVTLGLHDVRRRQAARAGQRA